MKFFLKCEEAAHICDKNQYKEASFLEKMRLWLHICYCRLCRGYSFRNGKLTRTIKTSDLKTLRPEEKQLLKERLRQSIDTE